MADSALFKIVLLCDAGPASALAADLASSGFPFLRGRSVTEALSIQTGVLLCVDELYAQRILPSDIHAIEEARAAKQVTTVWLSASPAPSWCDHVVPPQRIVSEWSQALAKHAFVNRRANVRCSVSLSAVFRGIPGAVRSLSEGGVLFCSSERIAINERGALCIDEGGDPFDVAVTVVNERLSERGVGMRFDDIDADTRQRVRSIVARSIGGDAHGRGRSLLVLDDSAFGRAWVSALFEQAGFAVVACERIAQAAKALSSRRFDLVIADDSATAFSPERVAEISRRSNGAAMFFHAPHTTTRGGRDYAAKGTHADMLLAKASALLR